MQPCFRNAGRRCPEPLGYRIRSTAPISGMLWPAPGASELDVEFRCLAVSIAAKSHTAPDAAIEVVHRGSGQLIYRKAPAVAPRPTSAPPMGAAIPA